MKLHYFIKCKKIWLLKLEYHNVLEYYISTFITGTHKQVLWQTVNTQMKFHQCPHCMLRQNDLRGQKYDNCQEIKACDPSKYTLDHFDFVVSNMVKKDVQKMCTFDLHIM